MKPIWQTNAEIWLLLRNLFSGLTTKYSVSLSLYVSSSQNEIVCWEQFHKMSLIFTVTIHICSANIHTHSLWYFFWFSVLSFSIDLIGHSAQRKCSILIQDEPLSHSSFRPLINKMDNKRTSIFSISIWQRRFFVYAWPGDNIIDKCHHSTTANAAAILSRFTFKSDLRTLSYHILSWTQIRCKKSKV